MAITDARALKFTAIRFFQLADIVLQPEQVSRHWGVLTSMVRMRRECINAKCRLRVPTVGDFRAVATFARGSPFWRALLENPRDYAGPDSGHPVFFPLEAALGQLNLSTSLPVVWPRLGNRWNELLQNFQPAGWVRIYPPGVAAIVLQAKLSLVSDVDVRRLAELTSSNGWVFHDNRNQSVTFAQLCEHIVSGVCKAVLPNSLATANARLRDTIPMYYVYQFDDAGIELPQDVEAVSELITAVDEEASARVVRDEMRASIAASRRRIGARRGDFLYAGRRTCLLHLEATPGSKLTRGQRALLDACHFEVEALGAAASALQIYAELCPGWLADLEIWLGRAQTVAEQFQLMGSLELLLQRVQRMHLVLQGVRHLQNCIRKQQSSVLMGLREELWPRLGAQHQVTIAGCLEEFHRRLAVIQKPDTRVRNLLDTAKVMLDLIQRAGMPSGSTGSGS